MNLSQAIVAKKNLRSLIIVCNIAFLFLCALDILEFHLTHEKQKFGQMAHEMFETIKQGTAVLEL